MRKYLSLLFVSILGGMVTLGVYIGFFKQNPYNVEQKAVSSSFIPTNYRNIPTAAPAELTDFTVAAENTVNAVVHVKNLSVSTSPPSLYNFFYGSGIGKEHMQIGTGSGVIISPDGYIVTNNHVIDNSKELQVTLNNNKSYEARLIGTDPSTDIALLKIDSENPLPYLIFGDSNNTKIGEWVLAVGNPFNLTSTVTAGIISAKARDLNENDRKNQSFIQTDAAVNSGNSGGALVNTRGELIGINTAITSQTGSYVGYSFAVPSNIARKVVEDIMDYGNVQKGILGIRALPRQSPDAIEKGLHEIEGVYIAQIEEESGAEKAGLRSGDIIKEVDGVKIAKFSDLIGYINSKRPNDVVDVTIQRDEQTMKIPVKLYEKQTYELLGLVVKNLSGNDKKEFKTKHGVKIVGTSEYLSAYGLNGKLLLQINKEAIDNIEDAKHIYLDQFSKSNYRTQPISIVVLNKNGEKERLIFR